LVSIAISSCSMFSDLHHQVTDHQLPICSFWRVELEL
jgi:hypothetical protein